MASMTSAYANKILKRLDEEKSELERIESSSCTYIAAVGEENPVIPEYDFEETNRKIAEINEKIQKIKHAVNMVNTTQPITVNDERYTVDVILVRMSQLNARKAELNTLRKTQPQSRRASLRLSDPKIVEYEYANFDPEKAKAEYQRVSDEIMSIQLALDKHNQTYVFDVDVDI